MIKEYEIKILDFFQLAVPSIKESVYAEKEDLFEVYNKRKLSPSFYYHRIADTLTLTKSITVSTDKEPTPPPNGVTATKFFIVPMKYYGYIMVEKQSDLLDKMAELRFYWDENPYLQVPITLELPTDIPVALRLLYIKVVEIRSIKEDKGPLRCIECSWESQLYLSKQEIQKLFTKVVVNVNNQVTKEFNKPNTP